MFNKEKYDELVPVAATSKVHRRKELGSLEG